MPLDIHTVLNSLAFIKPPDSVNPTLFQFFAGFVRRNISFDIPGGCHLRQSAIKVAFEYVNPGISATLSLVHAFR